MAMNTDDMEIQHTTTFECDNDHMRTSLALSMDKGIRKFNIYDICPKFAIYASNASDTEDQFEELLREVGADHDLEIGWSEEMFPPNYYMVPRK
jgi:hypothetical protein